MISQLSFYIFNDLKLSWTFTLSIIHDIQTAFGLV